MLMILEAVTKAGQVFYFMNEDEMRASPESQKFHQSFPRQVWKIAVAREDAVSEQGYRIYRGREYPVIEETRQNLKLCVVIPLNGHSVVWFADRFELKLIN